MERCASLVVVVPVKGKGDLLHASISSLSVAVARCAQASLVLVDNNEEDASSTELRVLAESATIVRSRAQTVGRVRNDGVRQCDQTATYIAFVDCDCVVKPTFCNDILEAFERSSSAIVGCRVVSPSNGHWTEIASDALHRQEGDGLRSFLNSGCLAVRAESFDEVGGFSEILPSNEDYDFCARVRECGGTIWQFESLQAVHLGNPKSVFGFLRRLHWHGRGVVREDGSLDFSPMLVATLANSVAVILGVITAGWAAYDGAWLKSAASLLLGLVLVPAAFWSLRILQFRRWIRPVPSVALMQLTFVARQLGLLSRLRELRGRRSHP